MAPRFDSPPPDSLTSAKPQPRPPKSPAQAALIRIHNRRHEYLERHPDYFKSMKHEFADPLLYDALIRRFQSAAEREAEGRVKGYGRILEGSIARSEERREKEAQSAAGEVAGQASAQGSSRSPENMSPKSASKAPSFVLEVELAPPPQTKVEGRERWQAFLHDRFIHGGDDEFEYPLVDENDEYDVLERKDREEAWFDEEDPRWASDASGELDERGERMKVDKLLEGETGIQDF